MVMCRRDDRRRRSGKARQRKQPDPIEIGTPSAERSVQAHHRGARRDRERPAIRLSATVSVAPRRLSAGLATGARDDLGKARPRADRIGERLPSTKVPRPCAARTRPAPRLASARRTVWRLTSKRTARSVSTGSRPPGATRPKAISASSSGGDLPPGRRHPRLVRPSSCVRRFPCRHPQRRKNVTGPSASSCLYQ